MDSATGSVGGDLAALHLVGVGVAKTGTGNAGNRLEVLEVGTEHFAVEHLGYAGLGLGNHRHGGNHQSGDEGQQGAGFHGNILSL
ncbi:hypothetical protein D3C81_1117270 [compost metagenome]